MIIDDFIIEAIDRPLRAELVALKPKIVQIAQHVYDEWEGYYGLCKELEEGIRHCIDSYIERAITSRQTKNFFHYWTRVWNEKECYDIDIPFGKYETYDYKTKSFVKIPNVRFTTYDIYIYRSTKSSLKTPWEVRKGYVPPKTDKYYMSEAIKLDKVTATNGIIDSTGWLLPDGKFVPLNEYSHLSMALKMGFTGYGGANKYGCIRIVMNTKGKVFMESSRPMTEEKYKLIMNAIKRMKNAPEVNIWLGNVENFKHFVWDGRQIVQKKYNQFNENSVINEEPDFGYKNFVNRDEDIAKLKWVVELSKIDNKVDAIKIRALDPTKDYTECRSVHGPYEGLIAGSKVEDNALQVKLSRITSFSGFERHWESTGLGQMLYDRFIDAAKKYGFDTVLSDYTLSGPARKAWAKLSQRYPVEKVKENGTNIFRIDLNKV